MWEVKIFNTDVCKSICDKRVKTFANKISDKGYYFYEPRKTRGVKRLRISGLILTAHIKCVTSFVECQIQGVGAQKFKGPGHPGD